MSDNKIQLAHNFIQHTNTSVFLTGKAGTGKTTFLKNVRENVVKKMIVLAPTGIAAINAKGTTIHSFFQLPFHPYIPGTELGEQKNKFSWEKLAIIRSLDLIIIDEISMVRPDVLDAVDFILRKYRRNDKPFAGVQLLLIGDLNQLPPVVKDEERSILQQYYDSPYFFSSHALRQINYVCIELTKIYRQSDADFINLLEKVRNNNIDENVLNTLNSRFQESINSDTDGYITLTTHNNTAKDINTERLQEIKNKPRIFIAKQEGDFPEYSYPTDEHLVLKKGAQVMFIKNDSGTDRRYHNGKIGVITNIDDKSVTIECEDDLKPITVEPVIWENVKYSINKDNTEIIEEVVGTFTQLPLKLAWAITIHKSQGLTFDKVIIDAQDAFTHGQVYVALSRCRTLEGIILLSKLNRYCIRDDYRVKEYSYYISENQPDKNTLNYCKQNYFLVELSEQFSFNQLRIYFASLQKIIKTHYAKSYGSLNNLYIEALQHFDDEVITIAQRFCNQFNILAQDMDNLQNRVKSGAKYFYDKCNDIIKNLLDNTNVDTDSKETEKIFFDAFEKCYVETSVKLNTLQKTSIDGFDVVDYLRIKEQSAVDANKSSLKNRMRKKEANEDIAHPYLYRTIKEWRNAEAQINDVPVYTILQNKSIVEIANFLPTTKKELLKITGIGTTKYAKYGKELIDIVIDYKSSYYVE